MCFRTRRAAAQTNWLLLLYQVIVLTNTSIHFRAHKYNSMLKVMKLIARLSAEKDRDNIPESLQRRQKGGLMFFAKKNMILAKRPHCVSRNPQLQLRDYLKSRALTLDCSAIGCGVVITR